MAKPVATIDYQLFFNALPSPCIAFLPDDPHFTIVAQNDAHAKIALGDTTSKIGVPLLTAFPDNSEKYKKTGVSDLVESFRRVVKTGQPDKMPLLKYDLKDDKGNFVERWWQVTHYPLFDVDGKLLLLYQATNDITNEIQAAQKLELAQSQLDSALAIGLVSTWSWNMVTDVLTGDKNLAKSFGIKPELAAKGLPLHVFTDSIHVDDRDRVLKLIQKSVDTDVSYEAEYRTVNNKDETRWVIARGKIEKDLDGKATYFLGVIVDITDRKQAEAELERIKSMFNALFESTILNIVMADTHGTIHEANKTFLKTFGYTKADLKRGLTSKDVTPVSSRSITDQVYDSLRTKGESEPVEKDYMRKDGSIIPMMVGAAMLPGSDELFMGFMLDISENKELIALNQAKDEFIGMASHQLRTPATAVKQYLSLLQTGFAGALSAEQQVFADKAYISNERQLTIVNDLLKTAQIDSNRYLLKKELTPLTELITQAIEELEEPLIRKDQKVTTTIDDATIKIFADRTELNLVLVNLIENASKYSPDKSAITIESSTKNNFVCIKICDEGVGIALPDQKRIFEKFTRVDNKFSDTVSGSGLGLYWTKRILKLHGGDIRVKSAAGKGSTFVVSLPYEH